MTDFAVQPNSLVSRRFASWTRYVAVIFAATALLALSFALGRVTIGHTGHSTTVVPPAVVQPVAPVSPAGGPLPVGCHLRGPC
jgi:hypothetical protein